MPLHGCSGEREGGLEGANRDVCDRKATPATSMEKNCMASELKKIFVVDDNNGNLIACKNILRPYYEVYPAQSVAKLFELLEHLVPDLILLDVEMPDISGTDAARKLKSNDSYKNIPIIFLSARNDSTSEMEGFNLGALDYIHKPFFSHLLLRRIEMHLSLIAYHKILGEVKEPLNSITKMLDEAVKNDDNKIIPQQIEGINNSVKQLFNSINSVLDMSKIWDKKAGGQ
jgi:DNA-binding response OmpR family regulator